jgi:competence protein ComGC
MPGGAQASLQYLIEILLLLLLLLLPNLTAHFSQTDWTGLAKYLRWLKASNSQTVTKALGCI